MHLSGRQWILAVGFAALGGAGAIAVIGEPVAPAGAGEKKRSRENSSIQKTKEKGFNGVDFSYDLFGAPPGQSAAKMADEVMAKDIAEKPKVMAKQARLLKDRYRLDCKTHPGVLMTKGKPQPIGPTVQLKDGIDWEGLSEMSADEIRKQKAFPPGFMRLPHVKQEVGGQVFPQKQIEQFLRLERFDVDFDLPDCFLPEFPPPIFLTTHPELGDVSQARLGRFPIGSEVEFFLRELRHQHS